MSTTGPGNISEDGDDVGADAGASQMEAPRQLRDLAPSSSDPQDDLVLPKLSWPAWQVLLDPARPERDVHDALRAAIAWRAARRLREAHRLPLWAGEDEGEGRGLPTPFTMAQQWGTDREDVRDRIEDLEQLTFDLLAASPEVVGAMLRAGDGPQVRDSRMAVLHRASARDPQERAQLLASNQVREPGQARSAPPRPGDSRRQTEAMISAGARWGLHLARLFQQRFRRVGPRDGVDLRPDWWSAQHQGRNAGCVGYAVSELLRIQLNDRNLRPSARYLWQGAKELDGERRPTTFVAQAGTSLRGALQLARRVGFALESELPSDSPELFQGSLDEFYRGVAGRRLSAVMNLGLDFKLWLSALTLGRPIVCAVQINREFVGLRAPRDRLPDFRPDERGLSNHAVVVTGFRLAPEVFTPGGGYELHDGAYDLVGGAAKADSKDPSDTRSYFPVEYQVVNSFGPEWGNGGWTWVPHRFMRLMAYEAYGALLAPDEIAKPGGQRPPRAAAAATVAAEA